LFSLGFLVCLADGGHDLLVVIEEIDAQSAAYEDAGYQSSGLDALGGGGTGAVGTLAQQQRAGDDYDALAQLIGKVAGSQEHAGPVLAGLDGIILGKVCEHGGGDDIGNGDGHGDDQTDEDGEGRTADGTDDQLVAVDRAVEQHIGDAGTQEHGLLAHLPGQDIHQRIGAHTHTDGNNGDDGDPHIRQGQKIRNVVDLGRVEEGKGNPHHQIADGNDGEIAVAENSLQRLAQRLRIGLLADVVLFPDGQCGNHGRDSAANAAHDKGDPQGPDLADASAHQHALGHGSAEHQGIRDNIEQAVDGIEEHPAFRLGDDLRLKGRIRNVIQRGEQIIQNQQNADPDGIEDAGTVYRREEDHQAAKTVRNGAPAHEGDSSAQSVLAVIGQVRDPGVRNGIHDGADAPDNRHHQGGVQKELGQSGIRLGGNEEGQKIGGDDAVDHTAGKVAHAEGKNLGSRQFFHASISFAIFRNFSRSRALNFSGSSPRGPWAEFSNQIRSLSGAWMTS